MSTEQNMDQCCQESHWIIRNSIKRQKELQKFGFSSKPRIAVCSKCGHMVLIDGGIPDENYKKKKYRQRQNNNYNGDK